MPLAVITTDYADPTEPLRAAFLFPPQSRAKNNDTIHQTIWEPATERETLRGRTRQRSSAGEARTQTQMGGGGGGGGGGSTGQESCEEEIEIETRCRKRIKGK